MARTDILVLDLDGTLVDTLGDLTAALAPVLERRGLRPLTIDEVRPLIGDGLAALLDRAFARRGEAAGADDLAAYRASYDRCSGQLSRLYPGAEAALAAAAGDGYVLAVCTNKPEAAARALLAALGVAARFAAICGGDSFAQRKPDPAHLLLTIAAAGGDRSRAVMLGDLHHDLEAARDASVRSVWASWGYGGAENGALADATADTWSEVPRLCGRLLGAA